MRIELRYALVARGGSAGGRERRQAGAHVGDQLVADAHQREPEQVLDRCARRLGLWRPRRSRWGCPQRARRGWVKSSAERYGSSANLPRSAHSITSNLTSQSARLGLASGALGGRGGRRRGSCVELWREVALHAEPPRLDPSASATVPVEVRSLRPRLAAPAVDSGRATSPRRASSARPTSIEAVDRWKIAWTTLMEETGSGRRFSSASDSSVEVVRSAGTVASSAVPDPW